jgi:5-hydroxyisourate hydrolase
MAKLIGRLTTHVLDTAGGKPAAGMKIELSVLEGSDWKVLKELRTNADGRTDAPLLEGAALRKGRYRLLFDVSAYYAALGMDLADPPFLERVPLCFGVGDAEAHNHVPLLCSPWAYSTYRGS